MQKILRSFVSISTIFVMVFSPFTSLTPTALAAPGYLMGSVDAQVTGALQLSISGSASATQYVGTDNQQFVTIDWGEIIGGNPARDTFNIKTDGHFATNFTAGKNFTTTWTPISHTYSSAGIKTILVKVHHQAFPGNESDTSEFTADVFVPPAALHVIKHVINDNGRTAVAGNFTVSVTGSSPNPASFPGAESPGTTVAINTGAYSVSEDSVEGYLGALSTDCSGTIASGQTKTCTITNNDIAQCIPTTEVCDNLDNDCDGSVDEDLIQPTTCGVGVCAGNTGTKTCTAGVWGNDNCDPYQGATGEVCDSGQSDEDCDGLTNEGCECINGTTQPCGQTDVGECSMGTQTCIDGAWSNECVGAINPDDEICDGLDNDCDGQIENGFNIGQACTAGVGACQTTGTYVCTQDGLGTQCNAVPGLPSPEICDNQIDDDCDGFVDLLDTDCQECTPAAQRECSTGLLGICSSGAQTCSTEGTWGSCISNNQPITEVCDNGLDDDCDGYTDATDTNCQECTPQAASPFEDNFNSYTDGNLNGQGSWVVSQGTVDVQGTTVFEGAKAIYAGANGIAYKAGDSLSDGRVVFYLKSGDNSADFYMSLKEDNHERILFGINLTGTRTVDYNNGSQWVNIGTFTADEWFSLEVEWRSSDHTARYRFAEGTWTDWASAYGIFTAINTIDFEGAPATQTYIDYITENHDTNECSTNLQGICAAGTQTCNQSGFWGSCVQTNQPVTEICDNQLDDDCDGLVDTDCQVQPSCGDGSCNGNETCSTCSQDCGSCPPTPECTPQTTEACSTGLQGICSTGTKTCTTGGMWGTCTQTNSSTTEICDNQLDDDCDGVVNNGCPQPPVCGDSQCNGNETCSSCSQDCGSCGGGGGGGGLTLIIFNEMNGDVLTTTAIVTWFTSLPATTRIVYDTVPHDYDFGTTPNYGYAYSTPEDSDRVTFHTVTITGLTPNTTYYWRAISHGSGEVWGQELVFTTITSLPVLPPTPPELSPEGTTPPEEVVLPPTGEEVGIPEEFVPEGVAPPQEEVVSIPQPSGNPFINFLANIGASVLNANIGASVIDALGLGNYPCLPLWLILILAIYSLSKIIRTWKEEKKEAKIWFIWLLILIILAICFYLHFFACLNIWTFVVLGVITFLIRLLISKKA